MEKQKKYPINDLTEGVAKEIRGEQKVHPLFPKEALEGFIKAGMYDIDNVAGTRIDYETDLAARSLLKSYVFYAVHHRTAEFKEVYNSEYVSLQIKYH